MPFCSVLLCKNQSKTQNVANGSISYHRFPKDGFIKEKWIDATGKRNWMPTKYSTICSNHFLPEDFIISKKGNRFLVPGTVPTQDIIIFVNDQTADMDTVDESTESSKQFGITAQNSNALNAAIMHESSLNLTNATPIEKTLVAKLRWCEDRLKKQFLKIKRLQCQNIRYRRKIESLQDILKNSTMEIYSTK